MKQILNNDLQVIYLRAFNFYDEKIVSLMEIT